MVAPATGVMVSEAAGMVEASAVAARAKATVTTAAKQEGGAMEAGSRATALAAVTRGKATVAASVADETAVVASEMVGSVKTVVAMKVLVVMVTKVAVTASALVVGMASIAAVAVVMGAAQAVVKVAMERVAVGKMERVVAVKTDSKVEVELAVMRAAVVREVERVMAVAVAAGLEVEVMVVTISAEAVREMVRAAAAVVAAILEAEEAVVATAADVEAEVGRLKPHQRSSQDKTSRAAQLGQMSRMGGNRFDKTSRAKRHTIPTHHGSWDHRHSPRTLEAKLEMRVPASGALVAATVLLVEGGAVAVAGVATEEGCTALRQRHVMA